MHERLFGCPIRFGASHNGLLLAREVLDRPSTFAHLELAEAHELFAKAHLKTIDESSLTSRVRRILLPHLESGIPNVQIVARELGMSVRSLQRRLTEESASYARVIDGLRREVAEEQLRLGDVSLGEIAYVTGYADVSAFQRAFKRWTQQTPSQFRLNTQSPSSR